MGSNLLDVLPSKKLKRKKVQIVISCGNTDLNFIDRIDFPCYHWQFHSIVFPVFLGFGFFYEYNIFDYLYKKKILSIGALAYIK